MITILEVSHHFFFFQAEDGIRDLTVTGVQTCALPISIGSNRRGRLAARPGCCTSGCRGRSGAHGSTILAGHRLGPVRVRECTTKSEFRHEIGRASCRERVEISVVAGSLKKKKKKLREG